MKSRVFYEKETILKNPTRFRGEKVAHVVFIFLVVDESCPAAGLPLSTPIQNEERI
jgi:hypothetical protein